MADPSMKPPMLSLEDERERLRTVIETGWSRSARQGRLPVCALCGVLVDDEAIHIAWHLRNLQ